MLLSRPCMRIENSKNSEFCMVVFIGRDEVGANPPVCGLQLEIFTKDNCSILRGVLAS